MGGSRRSLNRRKSGRFSLWIGFGVPRLRYVWCLVGFLAGCWIALSRKCLDSGKHWRISRRPGAESEREQPRYSK